MKSLQVESVWSTGESPPLTKMVAEGASSTEHVES